MTTEDDYLRSVERMLRGIGPEHRSAVLEDLRGHFADAEDAGRPVDEIVRSLGTPREIADRAVEEFGADAVAGDDKAELAWRVLQGAGVVVALVVGVVVAFILPSHTIATSDGGMSVLHHLTVFQNDGLWVALIALVPALVALVPMVAPRRARTATASVAAVVLTLMALVGGFTLGGFFLPAVMLAWAAMIVWVRLRGSGFGGPARITGGALTVAPTLLLLAGIGTGGAFDISAWAWPLLAVIVVLGVLIGLGIRSAGWLLAALGLVILVGGLASGELLTLLVIWLGGWWLTIGLAHAVTASVPSHPART